MLVKDAMNKNVKICRPDCTVKEAAKMMSEQSIGSLIIMSASGLISGIVTEKDIMKKVVAEGKNSDEMKVEDIMSKELITISPEETLEEAANVMTQNKIKKLPVVVEGALVGIITASDLIAYEHTLVEKVGELLVSSNVKKIGG